MINFRYHIVSLTAVFLALVIGILMGTTVVSKATVDGLKANLRRAEARSAAVHRTNERLTDEVSTRTRTAQAVDEALSEQALANTVDQLLDAVPVLVITTDHVDKDILDRISGALDDADATVAGTLVLNDRLAADGKDADQLRELLETSGSADPGAVAVRRLAQTLVEAARPEPSGGDATTTTLDAPSTTLGEDAEGEADRDADEPDATTTTTLAPKIEPTVLDLLVAQGYAKFRGPSERPDDAPILQAPDAEDAVGYRYVVVSGAHPGQIDRQIVLPMVAAMARLGPVPLVVATGPADLTDPAASDALLEDLLGRPDVEGRVSTVDDVGSFAGDVAVVFALVDAATGEFGNYGLGDVAGSVLPEGIRRQDRRSGPTG